MVGLVNQYNHGIFIVCFMMEFGTTRMIHTANPQNMYGETKKNTRFKLRPLRGWVRVENWALVALYRVLWEFIFTKDQYWSGFLLKSR